MAKGKKKSHPTCRRTVENTNHKASSKDTKENNSEMSGNNVCQVQQTIKKLWSPSKQRSPLCDNSSLLLPEGSGFDKSTLEESKLKKDGTRKTTSNGKVSKTSKDIFGRTSNDLGSSEPITEQLQEETLISNKNPAPASDSVPLLKENSTGHKLSKKVENQTYQNRKVTEYYPIRRSSRKTKAELKKEEQSHIVDLIKNGVEEGMKVECIEGKGRGVFAVKGFKKGDFVVEYHGDLLSLADAKRREDLYAQDPGTGCYMYYFQYHGKAYCIDATKETDRLGRLINHSKNGNCQTKLHGIDGTPHLILVASRNIEAGEELLYDYGDRSKASVSAHPWLKH